MFYKPILIISLLGPFSFFFYFLGLFTLLIIHFYHSINTIVFGPLNSQKQFLLDNNTVPFLSIFPFLQNIFSPSISSLEYLSIESNFHSSFRLFISTFYIFLFLWFIFFIIYIYLQFLFLASCSQHSCMKILFTPLKSNKV